MTDDLIDAPTAFDISDPVLDFMRSIHPEREHPPEWVSDLEALIAEIELRAKTVGEIPSEMVLELDRKALEELHGSSV